MADNTVVKKRRTEWNEKETIALLASWSDNFSDLRRAKINHYVY